MLTRIKLVTGKCKEHILIGSKYFWCNSNRKEKTYQGNLQLGKNRDKRFEEPTGGGVPESSSMDFFLIL